MIIPCDRCGAMVPRDTTTYSATYPDVIVWCCSCLAESSTESNYGIPAITEDEAWTSMMERESVPCLAVPIDLDRIPMNAVITFLPGGEA